MGYTTQIQIHAEPKQIYLTCTTDIAKMSAFASDNYGHKFPAFCQIFRMETRSQNKRLCAI